MGNLIGVIMVDYWFFTVVELKDILRQRGLGVGHNLRKYQLIARLRAEEEPILLSGEYVDITEYIGLSRADDKDFLKPFVRNLKHKQTKQWLGKFKPAKDLIEEYIYSGEIIPNWVVDDESFGGYAWMSFKTWVLTIDKFTGQLIESVLEGKSLGNYGTSWDIRDSQTAINELTEAIKKMLGKSYVFKIEVVEAQFINPSAWGEPLRRVG